MKKFVSILFAVIVCISSQGTSLAISQNVQDDADSVVIKSILDNLDLVEEAKLAEKNYIDKNVEKSVLDGINVWTSDENSEVRYSVRRAGHIDTADFRGLHTSGRGRNVYIMTVVNCPTNTVEEYNIKASLTLMWIDNFGTSNQLSAVSGYWVTRNEVILERGVEYGVTTLFGGYTDYESHSPTTNQFYYTPDHDMIGYSFLAVSAIQSEYSAEDNGSYIFCSVASSIYD